MQILSIFLFFFSICSTASAFVSPQSCATTTHNYNDGRVVSLCAEPTSDQEQEQRQSTELDLSQAQGGYTLKQRLREEIDSPFRKVRLAFFTASFGSAMIALYFSALNTAKTMAGGFADAQPLDEVLTSDAINLGAVIACGVLVYRDYKLGQANLDKLARGGRLASLIVEPAAPQEGGSKRLEMKSYRRQSRVLIAAGGKEYISSLARSMTSDQLTDTNTFPEKLLEVDMVIVPVLLENLSSNNGKKNQKVVVGDTRGFWTNGIEADPETDRNFDISKADSVISFPTGSNQWSEYLKSEIETAATQGYDVLEKGITLTVKKNGKILRRATGLPPFGDLIGTMEVMDGKCLQHQ
ncbi:hypothetical protein FRACYDRAFT_239006 [Fragilariopsis cylindrus CCMP1102]|uniref:Uncharacterized protein n=1 Tax=Fragilariopsis cylindrus CCMP1102 TaxID=635003 RepID=A0A1E7FE06_9STRA|nr:hypothetical protein FRACYDRAFT_239006 [Fragilariopsis cylindrus CCMP1102]|eukprot:OEU16412.1 hypothetical protein FRACYDRAFT_239006 [Fragilariopsis cylindrus CCMP1102]